jgi:hypothetical protein
MRSALPLCLAILTWASSVRADDDDYKPDPITRHWRVRVSFTEHDETHLKKGASNAQRDEVLDINASYSFVTGTTDNDLTGNAYGFSQIAEKGLSGLTGTGSFHSKETQQQFGDGPPMVHTVEGNLDLKQSSTGCFYQTQANWDCQVNVAFSGEERWLPAGAVPPKQTTSGNGSTFGHHGGVPGTGSATKLAHERFTFTNDVVLKQANSAHQQHVTVDVEPLDSIGYEAVIVPDAGYEQWLPEGPPVAPSTHQPATLGMHVELRDAATHKPSAKSFRTHYTLESSKLVGDCMNYPPAGPPPPDKPDLYFEAAKNRSATIGNDTLSLDLGDGKGGGAVVVSSRDWGGYAKLRAKVVVSDGAVVDALTAESGKEVLTVPKDDDGNHIADEWEKNVHGSHAANADDESEPSGWAAPGDGYTLFEEYRGFIDVAPGGPVMVAKGPKKHHERFDPNKRDVLVGLAVSDSLEPLARDGIAAWAQVSGVAVHYVADRALIAKMDGDYDANYPRRADVWGEGHPDLFAKAQSVLWVQSFVALGTSTHADPVRAEVHFDGEIDESQTAVYGHFRDVKFVTINLAAANGTVDALICDIDPECKFMKNEHAEWQAALAPMFSKEELRKRAAWARANMDELDRRFTRFIFIHELGHAAGAYHHGKYSDRLHSSHGDKQCPMRYWHFGDNYLEVADFVGNKWSLANAHDGTPWRWCGENLPQMRISDYGP